MKVLISNILEFTPSTILLYPYLSPIPAIVSTAPIFHLHTSMYSIPTIFTLPHPFLTSSPLPLVPTPPQASLFSDFVNEKNYSFV
jgi:hypothetical protein